LQEVKQQRLSVLCLDESAKWQYKPRMTPRPSPAASGFTPYQLAVLWRRTAKSSRSVAAFLSLLSACATAAMASPFAYVARGGGGVGVAVVDLATNTWTTSIQVDGVPRAIAATPDGNWVYVPDSGSGEVSVISTATNTVDHTIDTSGPGGWAVAVAPDGKWVYAVSPSPSSVTAIDTSKNLAAPPVPVGDGAGSIAITPDGNWAYVGAVSGLYVIYLPLRTVTATIPGFSLVATIAIAPNGFAYVTGALTAGIAVIDTSVNSVVTTIPRPDPGTSLGPTAIAPNGTAYVAANGSDSSDDGILVVDTTRNVSTGFSFGQYRQVPLP
jgi:YVTN family beta-propeller protein